MDDKRELNDILIGGEDVKSKNTKKLILLIISIVVLIIAIAAIALNLSSSNTEEVVVDLNSPAPETSIPSNDQFDNVPVNDDSIQFEQIVKEIRSRQQNAPEQSGMPIPSAPSSSNGNEEKIKTSITSYNEYLHAPVVRLSGENNKNCITHGIFQ